MDPRRIRRLGAVCTIACTGVTGLVIDDFPEDGTVPVVGNGKQPRAFHNFSNIPASSIIISRTGAFGNVSKYSEPIFLTNESFYVTDISPGVDADYLYVMLLNILSKKLRKGRYRVSSLKKERVENMYIYVPDLGTQRELANAIDDSFSNRLSLNEVTDPESARMITQMVQVLPRNNRSIERFMGEEDDGVEELGVQHLSFNELVRRTMRTLFRTTMMGLLICLLTLVIIVFVIDVCLVAQSARDSFEQHGTGSVPVLRLQDV